MEKHTRTHLIAIRLTEFEFERLEEDRLEFNQQNETSLFLSGYIREKLFHGSARNSLPALVKELNRLEVYLEQATKRLDRIPTEQSFSHYLNTILDSQIRLKKIGKAYGLEDDSNGSDGTQTSEGIE